MSKHTTQKKHRLRTALLITLPTLTALAALLCYLTYTRYYYSVRLAPSPFAETAAPLDNPYQGWYHLYGYQLNDQGTPDMQATQKHIKESSGNRLVLLEINLCEYRERELSVQALSMLESILSAWKNSPCQMILRFLYDWNGAAAQTEPQSGALIQHHMTQCADIVNRFADNVYMIQGIFVGNYGEMHGSVHLEEEDIRALANQLVMVTDPSIFLAVRTPCHWRTINRRFTPLSEKEAFLNTPAARFGLFNDGMLGSDTDLDSYSGEDNPAFENPGAANDFTQKGSRQQELDFQDALCAYVPNGGEVVIDNPYNDLPQAIDTLAKTHVSYLNCDYDQAVLEKWKRTIYNGNTENEGSGDCFQGMDGYQYIGSHLGYRFFAADVKLSQPNGPFQLHPASLELTVKNSGFANCPRKFQAEVTIKKNGGQTCQTIPADTDTRLWNAGDFASLTVPLDIRGYGCGDYTVYFKLSDRTAPIRLANDLPFDARYGYEIAQMHIGK